MNDAPLMILQKMHDAVAAILKRISGGFIYFNRVQSVLDQCSCPVLLMFKCWKVGRQR